MGNGIGSMVNRPSLLDCLGFEWGGPSVVAPCSHVAGRFASDEQRATSDSFHDNELTK